MTDFTAQAAQARADYQKAKAAAEADADLSDAAKQRLVGEAREKTKAKLQELEGQHVAREEADRLATWRAAFGPGGRAGDSPADREARLANRRAADAAADALANADDAGRLLARALRNGDDQLARAVAAHAYERNWAGVVRAFADAGGEATAAALARLAEADRRRGNVGARLRDRLRFRGV